MTKTLFVGDIHGDTKALIRLTKYAMRLQKIERVIQVGDFSIDPADYELHWPFDIPLWFIAGNHDHYHALSQGVNLAPNVRYIKRGEIVDGILFVGGAYSVDKDLRVPGVDWFPEEQMSYEEWLVMLSTKTVIKIMVCHDTVSSVYHRFGLEDVNWTKNTHSVGLDMIFNQVKPFLYIHGHHHKRLTYEHNDCIFESLGTTSHYKRSQLRRAAYHCTVVHDV